MDAGLARREGWLSVLREETSGCQISEREGCSTGSKIPVDNENIAGTMGEAWKVALDDEVAARLAGREEQGGIQVEGSLENEETCGNEGG